MNEGSKRLTAKTAVAETSKLISVDKVDLDAFNWGSVTTWGHVKGKLFRFLVSKSKPAPSFDEVKPSIEWRRWLEPARKWLLPVLAAIWKHSDRVDKELLSFLVTVCVTEGKPLTNFNNKLWRAKVHNVLSAVEKEEGELDVEEETAEEIERVDEEEEVEEYVND
jgi:hypothetical protein